MRRRLFTTIAGSRPSVTHPVMVARETPDRCAVPATVSNSAMVRSPVRITMSAVSDHPTRESPHRSCPLPAAVAASNRPAASTGAAVRGTRPRCRAADLAFRGVRRFGITADRKLRPRTTEGCSRPSIHKAAARAARAAAAAVTGAGTAVRAGLGSRALAGASNTSASPDGGGAAQGQTKQRSPGRAP